MPSNVFPSVILAVLLAGVGMGSAAAQTSPALRGEAISLCARCHATGLTDDSPVGRAPAFRDLSKRYPSST